MDTEPSLLILQWELKGKQGTTEPLLLRREITQGGDLGRKVGGMGLFSGKVFMDRKAPRTR